MLINWLIKLIELIGLIESTDQHHRQLITAAVTINYKNIPFYWWERLPAANYA